MKKIVFGALSLSILYANDVETLGSMTISTATKSEKQIDGVIASVEVVTIEDLQNSGGITIRESLESVASFNAQHNSFPSASAVSKSSISIRGMSAAGTLVLIDGKRQAGEVQNPYDLDRIPAGAIERIEVVKGPMSTLYGADAMGGVINIITKKPTKEPAISLDIQTGANSDGDGRKSAVSFDARGKKESFEYSLFVSALETSPYYESKKTQPKLPNGNNHPILSVYDAKTSYQEESEVYTAGFRVADSFGDTKIGVDFSYMDETREGKYVSVFHPSKLTPPPVFNAPVRSTDENNRLNLGVDSESLISDDLTVKLRAYMSDYEKRNKTTALDYQNMGYSSEADSSTHGMDADVLVQAYEASAVYTPNGDHILSFGGEYRGEDRKATVFTDNDGKTSKSVDYKSLYVQDEWTPADDLEVILGARYDDISNADDKTTFRIGAIKTFDPMLKVRASFAQGFRAPDLRELYINRTTPQGKNEGAEVRGYNLKPEEVNAYEIGISGRDSKLFYEVVGFYNDVKNRITQVKRGAVNTFENIGKAEIYGAEASGAYKLDSGAKLKASLIKLSAKDKDSKKDIDFTVREKAVASIDVPFLSSFAAGTEVVYTGEQKYQENGAEKTADAFTLVNLRAKYEISKENELFVGINNLFDEKIDEVLGSSVGTFFYAGARLKF